MLEPNTSRLLIKMLWSALRVRCIIPSGSAWWTATLGLGTLRPKEHNQFGSEFLGGEEYCVVVSAQRGLKYEKSEFLGKHIYWIFFEQSVPGDGEGLPERVKKNLALHSTHMCTCINNTPINYCTIFPFLSGCILYCVWFANEIYLKNFIPSNYGVP